MAFGLLGMINEQRKAEKKVDDIVVTEMSYPTGFLNLDYANGIRVISYDDNDRPIAQTDLIGLVGGTMTTVIGISGTGKTALGIEFASSGIHLFGDKSAAQHADIEQATTMQRVKKTTKLPTSLLKKTYQITRDKGAEDILDQFKTHCQIKLDNRKMFTYKTGVLNLYGEEIIDMYPSSMLIDSFALFKSKDVDLMQKKVDDLTNNMRGAQDAKFNRAVLTQMLAYGKKANVSIIAINHINQDVNTGFLPKPSVHMFLSQGETMPGGTAALFLANNLIKLKLITKYNHDKPESQEYGIPGFLVEARFIKSRTNAANRPAELVFDHRYGRFSKTLTLFNFAVKNEVLQGSNRSMYIPGLESVKFTKKTFKDVVEKSPEVMQALFEACRPHLEALLSTDDGLLNRKESESDRLDAVMLALEDHQRDMEYYRQQNWIDF